MNRVCSIFSQLLQFFPRLEFEQAVRETRAERHALGFSCWGQFVAMLFCQLGQARSLREICGGLALDVGLAHDCAGIVDADRSADGAGGERPQIFHPTALAPVEGMLTCNQGSTGIAP